VRQLLTPIRMQHHRGSPYGGVFNSTVNRTLRIDRGAEADLLEAYVWYEDQELGLGVRFLDEVDATIQRILENPTIYPLVHRTTRRALVRTFPYAVYYQIQGDLTVVLACVHGSRSAQTWRRRLQ
jgi:plasmid stabilization system protein ParE